MAFKLSDYFQGQGLAVIELSLKGAVGKPLSSLQNEAIFRQQVIQPGWEALPVTVRMLMKRDFPRWDAMYLALRSEVYVVTDGRVQLRPDAQTRLRPVVGRFFGATAPSDDVPVATPVLNPDRTVPTALPVADASPPPARPVASTGPVIGIDLGTTFSVVAHVDAQGRPVSLLNADGDRLTPSVVLFGDDGTVVGKQAVLGSALEPDNTAEAVKRDMGAASYRRKVRGESMPPEVISSLILRSLKADAERALGPVRKAVITVPAYFDETRRRATVDAGRLAGLDVVDIINEPTAAAIAYGHQLGFLDPQGTTAGDQTLRVLVFDLGGGTFDVTVVKIRQGEFKALATDGDVCLGGKDWDEKLVELAAEEFKAQYGEDPRDNSFSLRELELAAESAKRTLTERPRATLFINHAGRRHKVDVTRERFEQATAALLERTRMTTEIVARQAGVALGDIDRILLVGGSTRMPMISRMLEELTGRPPDRSVSADEAVAHGAALYARRFATATGGEEGPADFDLTNVNSHSLGVLGTIPETGEHCNRILIPRNTPLPVTITKKFQTYREGQRAVVIKVLEGESPRPEYCSQVGTCTIKNLPANLPAGWAVSVSYSYEANGRLHVRARLKGYNAGVTTVFTRENSIPDEDLERWLTFIEREAGGASV